MHTRKLADITVSNVMLVHHSTLAGLFDSSDAAMAAAAGSNGYSWASSAEESESGSSCLIIASGSKGCSPKTRRYLPSTRNTRQGRAAWSAGTVTVWNWSIAHKNRGKTNRKALCVCVISVEVAELKPPGLSRVSVRISVAFCSNCCMKAPVWKWKGRDAAQHHQRR